MDSLEPVGLILCESVFYGLAGWVIWNGTARQKRQMRQVTVLHFLSFCCAASAILSFGLWAKALAVVGIFGLLGVLPLLPSLADSMAVSRARLGIFWVSYPLLLLKWLQTYQLPFEIFSSVRLPLAVMALASFTTSLLLALVEFDLKRLLGFWWAAFLPLIILQLDSQSDWLWYTSVFGAVVVVMLLFVSYCFEKRGIDRPITDDLDGLSRSYPQLGMIVSLAIVGLMAVPGMPLFVLLAGLQRNLTAVPNWVILGFWVVSCLSVGLGFRLLLALVRGKQSVALPSNFRIELPLKTRLAGGIFCLCFLFASMMSFQIIFQR